MPDDDPAVKQSMSQGLRAGGHGRSKLGPPKANSCVASLPSITVPASASLRTVVASASGTQPCNSLECAVVAMPAVP